MVQFVPLQDGAATKSAEKQENDAMLDGGGGGDGPPTTASSSRPRRLRSYRDGQSPTDVVLLSPNHAATFLYHFSCSVHLGEIPKSVTFGEPSQSKFGVWLYLTDFESALPK